MRLVDQDVHQYTVAGERARLIDLEQLLRLRRHHHLVTCRFGNGLPAQC